MNIEENIKINNQFNNFKYLFVIQITFKMFIDKNIFVVMNELVFSKGYCNLMKGNKMQIIAKIVSRSIFVLFVIFSIEFFQTPNIKAANIKIVFSDSTNGTVAPLAQFKKDADKNFKMVGTTREKWIANLPSKSDINIPIYPGTKLVVYQKGYQDSKEKLLPEIVLVSSDPLEKIENWYAAKLKGWNFIKAHDVFEQPGKTVDVMSDEFNAAPHVEIEKVLMKNQFDGMFLKQPADAKTGIIIRY